MDRGCTNRIEPDWGAYADLDAWEREPRGWIGAALSLLLHRGPGELIGIATLVALCFMSTRVNAESTTTGLWALLGLSVLIVAFATLVIFFLGRENGKVKAEGSRVPDEPGDEPGRSGEARQAG